ncbi:MAG: hypothetical protein ABS95_01045 [Verrucomicrobia bacterium SCN 57-15]|nr:MAG: hypothetical protein ABS95_01045 [Verrucomicrobia bacterium SCN 57-15]
MPTDNAKPYRRYKGFYRLEEEARQQLSEWVAGCKPEFLVLPPEAQIGIIERLRPEAQRAILNSLEGRTQIEDEHFGYDWSDVLPRIQPSPLRQAAGQFLLEQLPAPIRAALDGPEVSRRDKVEWLYHETVDRIRKFTPYLVSEEREVVEWKRQCPEAYDRAERAAQKAVRGYQDRNRKQGSLPALSDEARQLAATSYLIAARKLFQHVLDLSEYYDGDTTVVGLKVPPELQARFGPRAYVRLGVASKAASYRDASAEELEQFQNLLDGPILRNLQEKVCPWTTETASAQKIDANLLARVYFEIVRPLEGQEPKAYTHDGTLQHLGGDANYYRLLGFREDIAPEPSRIFEELLDSNHGLQEFLDQPSVQEAFKAHRLDLGIVELSLRAAVANELVSVARIWKPDCVGSQGEAVAQAQGVIPHVVADLAVYHDALMQGDYLSVRRENFFKERLMAEHLACITPKERAKIESYYRPIAVVLAARDDQSTEPVPSDWKNLRSYFDPVTKREYTDYQIELPEGRAILCLRKGASPHASLDAARRLLDLNQPAHVNDSAARVKGVRISELSFNELSSSCLRPISMARMQFYTSFSPAKTLEILRGASDEPTTENIIEVLRPCFVLRYSDAYCRVKPAEMIRVKYRTPTGEKKNPCWDASQALCGLRNPASDPNMRDRLENPKWGLIIIEGEKKAALLAQMCVERNLPYHVMSLPGVWMGLARGKLVEELDQFRMQDAKGRKRHCYIFFDNDKAFKAGVMHALIETAFALQRAGARVFVPNLPFGKKVKGTDDFAMAHCRRGDTIDYQPLIEILENAVHVPERPRKVKYPASEQEREINRKLNEAEQVHDLQGLLREMETPLEAPESRRLFLLQAPYLFKSSTERQNASVWDSFNERGRESLLQSLLKENPALKLLRQACGGIPSFDEGPTARDFVNGSPPAASQPAILVPELFAVS